MKKLGTILILFTLCSILTAQNFGLEFDGTYESEVIISQTSDLTPTAAITVEAWVKLDLLTNLPTILSSEDWSAGETGFVLRIENYNFSNVPQFQIGTSGSWQSVSAASGAIPYDEWTHVAGTFDGSAVKIFINGVEAGSTAYSGTILPSPIGVKIGGHVDHQFNNRQWDGSIDEVRIWDIARNSTELTATMPNSLSGSEEGLIGYWMFNEGNGTILNDTTENGNSGTIFGANWVDGAPVNMEAGTIEGVVNLIGGDGVLEEVQIEVNGLITTADDAGYFSMQVAPGDYDLNVSLAGYYPYTEAITVILDETIDITSELQHLAPPQNLTYTQEDNLLQWESPATELTFSSYKLYEGDSFLTGISSGDTSYQAPWAGDFHLTALYDSYESDPSNIVEVAIFYAPQNLILTLEDDNDARLNWEAPEDGGATLTGFKVYRDAELSAEVTSDIFTYTDENLPIAEYTFYVTALYTDQESNPSNVVEVEVLVGFENVEISPIVSLGNYPNPFNPTTEIRFQISDISEQDVEIEIYNVKGEKVKSFPVILSGVEGSGNTQSITWNGTDNSGNAVSSGIYFYKLKAGKTTLVRKMVLLK